MRNRINTSCLIYYSSVQLTIDNSEQICLLFLLEMSYVSLSRISPNKKTRHQKTRSMFTQNSRIVRKFRNQALNLQRQKRISPVNQYVSNQVPPSKNSIVDLIRLGKKQMESQSRKSESSIYSLKNRKQPTLNSLQKLKPMNSIRRDCNPTPSGNSDQNQETTRQENIESRIDELLEQHIRMLMTNKGNKVQADKTKLSYFCNSKLETQNRNKFDQEMAKLVWIVQKQKPYEQQSHDKSFSKWKLQESKIKLIQKILAGNETQLEIMKHYFNIFSNRRTTYKQMFSQNKRQNWQWLTKAQPTKTSNMQEDNISSSRRILVKLPIASTSKVAYTEPASDDYQKYRFKHPRHQSHKRYIPRTNYSASFKQFPNIKQHEKYFGEKDSFNKLGYSPFKGSTNYRKDFTSATVQIQDHRKLDCYRDKLKDIKISFFSNPEIPNPETQLQIALLERQANKRPKLERIQNPESPRLPMQSTSRLQHHLISDIDRKMFKNEPKNSRLRLMKYDLKQIAGF